VDVTRKLTAQQATQLVRECLKTGRYSVRSHARDEMADEVPPITEQEALTVLRRGKFQRAQRESWGWSYRYTFDGVIVCIGFRTPSWMVVVTTFRD
jgi:hypothetical protein